MKIRIRFAAAAVIAAALLASACAGSPAGNDTEPVTSAEAPAGSETDVRTEPVFAARDYSGQTFTVYMRSSKATSYAANYMIGEDNGSLCDEAALSRNMMVEEKYGVKLEFREASSPLETLSADIKGGDPGYDLILERRNSMGPKVTSGLLADLAAMDIDFSRPWWDMNCVEGYSLGGRLFLIANDISVSRFSNSYFLYFNKQILENYRLDDPYGLEKAGNWTLENFLGLVQSVSNVPADGSIGTYGMLTATGPANGTHMHLLTGCGIRFTSVDAEGKREAAVGDQLEKIDGIFSSIRTVVSESESTLTFSKASDMDKENLSGYANIYDHARSLFASGHFLFLHGGMGISSQFSDMENDYGAIVNPKYNADQTRYYHKIDPYALIFGAPNSPSVDRERLAIVSDYWAYISRTTLIPAYYEVTIKTKRVSDPTASAMIDTVRETIMYEMADVFGISISDAMNTAYERNNLAKQWTSAERTARATLKSLNEKIAALD